MKRTTIILCLLVFTTTNLFSQQFELPKPTGPYKIGTRYLYFVDYNRPDVFTSKSDDFRELSVQVWYPADPKSNEKPKNFGNIDALEYFVKFGFFKPSIIDDVALKPSHSYLNAKISKSRDPYPVILYSASGVMDANSLLAEDLASNGYIVFCIGHPHWCEYYFDANGKVFFRDKVNDEYNKKLWGEENSYIVIKTKEQLTRAPNVQEKLVMQKKLNEHMPLEINDIHLWVEDISFLIDELEKMNLSDEMFKGKLDLNRIGIMGYSKGGAAAGQACITEKRCKAGINLDGFMFGDIAEKPLTVPFMVMEFIEPWCKDCLPINELLFHTSKSSIYMLQIDGATHGNFTDVSAFHDYITEDFQGNLGSIDGKKFLRIQNDYILQFFNRHLKSLNSNLLDMPLEEYSEVRFKSRHP